MSESKDWKWEGEEVSVSGIGTKEDLLEALEDIKKKAHEDFMKPPPPLIVHPVGHRDCLIALQGYTKEKANKIVLEMAKNQFGWDKEVIEELKKNLEK